MTEQRPVSDYVAEEIRALMGRRRLSGNRLAAMSGIPQSSLARRLAGEQSFTRRPPTTRPGTY
jgi:hypothetical protein